MNGVMEVRGITPCAIIDWVRILKDTHLSSSLLSHRPFLFYLLQNFRISDPIVFRKEQHLRQDLGGLRIILHKGQEKLAAMLTVNRCNSKHGATLPVDNAAAQVHGVGG